MRIIKDCGSAARRKDVYKGLRTEIVIQLGKRQKLWAAALISSGCSLLDDTAKSELRRFLSFAGTESGDDANYVKGMARQVHDAAADDGNESDGDEADDWAGNGVECDGDEGDDDAGVRFALKAGWR